MDGTARGERFDSPTVRHDSSLCVHVQCYFIPIAQDVFVSIDPQWMHAFVSLDASERFEHARTN